MDIYATLGPACAREDLLRAMFDAGMTGIRLNLSHVSLVQAEKDIEKLQTAAERCGVKPKLLIDMQGPELRIGTLKSALRLETGDELALGEGGIPLPKSVPDYLVPGQELLLNDGKILAVVKESSGGRFLARVIRGGVLESRKSIALPGADIRPPTLSPMDSENIRQAASYGVTGLMQPFVRDRQDLETVRSAMDEAGGSRIELFAKIEDMNGVAQLHELIPACEEIVIARGDLGNSVELCRLPAVQKSIAEKCRAAGRRFMVVTQMLASMESSPVPTRAEVSDIFNAVLDGAASVMLTGETAVGAYPVQAVEYMSRTVQAALDYMGGTA